MTEFEMLKEAYHNAAYDLLMYEISKMEGESLEEEVRAMNADSGLVVPKSLDRAGQRLISRRLAAKTVRSVGRVAWKGVHRLALACLLLTSLFVAAFAASPTFRADTLNLVIETFDEGTRFRFTEAPMSTGIVINSMLKGFELTDSGTQNNVEWYYFERKDGSFISIACAQISSRTLNIDTEDANVDNMTINGNSAVLATKGVDIQALITNDYNQSVLQIETSGLSMDDFIEIAKNIIF